MCGNLPGQQGVCPLCDGIFTDQDVLGRRSGGVGEGVIAALVDGGFVGAARRIASADSFVPLGPAAQQVLIGEDAITQGAHALLAR